MSDLDDVIRIDLESDISEGEAAKRKLEDVSRATKELNESFNAGRIGLSAYKAELKDLEREYGRAQSALDKFNAAQIASGGQKLTGSDRAGAKARLGLAAANIAQDVIQGGPASAINNLLGLANDTKIRSLVMEFVEAAGGASGLASKLGVAGAAAAALFGSLDAGLRAAKLEWSDLDDVAGNLGPFKAARELFEGISQIAKDWHLDAAWNGASEAASGYVNAIADATLGWNAATEAARAHKEEVERSIKAAQEYAAAAKVIAGIRSEDQQEQARRGKAVGQELANLGGGGGINALIDQLARDSVTHGADDKVPVPELDDKGEPTGKTVEITRRESEKRRIASDVAAANAGDAAALERLRPRLRASGYNLGGVDATTTPTEDKDVAADRAERADRANAADKARLDAEYKAFTEEEKADAEAEKLFDEQERKYQERLNHWQAQGDQQVRDENLAAEQADAMTAWKKDRDRQNQAAQVFSGPAALRDAIQQSVRADKDPTAVETLAVSREIANNTRRMAEAREARQVARFG